MKQTLDNPNFELLPRDDEVFLSENINAVESLRTIAKDRVTPYADFRKQVATMEDGTRYIVTSTNIPDKYQRDSSDIMSLETSAWLTKGEGLYTRRALHLARLAMPSVFVGVQQNLSQWGNLPKAAHDQLEIASRIAREQDYDLSHTIGNGISRGAMASIIETSLASQHGIKKLYTDAIVPCFPAGMNPAKDVALFRQFPLNEMSTLRALRAVPLKVMLHLPQTFDMSARGIFQQAKELPTLLAGDVSRYATSMPTDSFGYLTAYEGDVMSQGSRYQEIFNDRDYPNMIVDLTPGGGHMKCASEDCCSDWKTRTTTIAELLHDDPSARHLGGTAFRILAAERNDVFTRPSDNQLSFAVSQTG